MSRAGDASKGESDLRDLAPDVVVRPSSDDYFAGRDPALRAILPGEHEF